MIRQIKEEDEIFQMHFIKISFGQIFISKNFRNQKFSLDKKHLNDKSPMFLQD